MKSTKLKIKRQDRKNRGITLIALVVTIVVLLILAAVSISMLGGENGIITQAVKTKEETRGASVEEERDLWKTNQNVDKYGSSTAESLTELIDRLVEKGLLTDDERDQIIGNEDKGIEGTGQVTIGSRTIVFVTGKLTLVEMFEKAKADGCTNEDGTCDNQEHLHIGDYVNFENPENAEYIVPTENTGLGDLEGQYSELVQKYTVSPSKNQLNWRVLGLDEETGGIKLTSGRPLKANTEIEGGEFPFLLLQGALAYTDGYKELDNICNALYKDLPFVDKARSININDVNELTGVINDEIIKEIENALR